MSIAVLIEIFLIIVFFLIICFATTDSDGTIVGRGFVTLIALVLSFTLGINIFVNLKTKDCEKTLTREQYCTLVATPKVTVK